MVNECIKLARRLKKSDDVEKDKSLAMFTRCCFICEYTSGIYLPVRWQQYSVLSLSCCIIYIIREVQLERAANEYRANRRGEKFYR